MLTKRQHTTISLMDVVICLVSGDSYVITITPYKLGKCLIHIAAQPSKHLPPSNLNSFDFRYGNNMFDSSDFLITI
jgi:hypothetical protein